MDRVEDGCFGEAPERDRERPRVVVDDIEVAGAVEARERVPKLGQRLADLLTRRLFEDVREVGLAVRVAGGEQRHVVAGVEQPVGEQRDDPLNPAIAARWDGEPDRADDRNMHERTS